MRALPEQMQRLLEALSSRWVQSALTKKPLNVAIVEDFVDRFYSENGLPAPEIHYASSPLASQHIALRLKALSSGWRNMRGSRSKTMEDRIFDIPKVSREVRNAVWLSGKVVYFTKLQVDTQVRRRFGRQFEEFLDDYRSAQACLFYDFFRRTGFLDRPVRTIEDYCRYVHDGGAFLTICEEANFIVCPNPKQVSFDDRGELHSADGPALSWDDGFKLCFLEGLPVADTFPALSSGNRADLALLVREDDAENRREILRRLDAHALVHGLGAETLDRCRTKWATYELLTVRIPGMDVRPTCLKMVNPSTGECHIETVPPVSTCKRALAWRDGETRYRMPQILT